LWNLEPEPLDEKTRSRLGRRPCLTGGAAVISVIGRTPAVAGGGCTGCG